MTRFDIRATEDEHGLWRAEARWIEARLDLPDDAPVKSDGDMWRGGVCVGPFFDIDVALSTLGRLLQELRVQRGRR